MATQRQYEFCHHVLWEMMWGGVEEEGGEVEGVDKGAHRVETRKGLKKLLGKKSSEFRVSHPLITLFVLLSVQSSK